MADDSKLESTKKRTDHSLQMAKNSASRVENMLVGVRTHKLETVLKGPVDFATSVKLAADFRQTCSEVDVVAVGKKTSGSDATAIERTALKIISTTQGFADVFYPYGAPGRSHFWSEAGKQSTEDNLAACHRGVQLDREGEKDAKGKVISAPKNLIPHTTETDLPNMALVLADLRAANAEAARHLQGRSGLVNRRSTLGSQLRKLAPQLEKVIRLLMLNKPTLLPDFGLRAR